MEVTLIFVFQMLRLPFLRSIPQVTRVASLGARTNSTAAPEKVEVFIDGQPVLVDPGTTVLQVIINLLSVIIFYIHL